MKRRVWLKIVLFLFCISVLLYRDAVFVVFAADIYYDEINSLDDSDKDSGDDENDDGVIELPFVPIGDGGTNPENVETFIKEHELEKETEENTDQKASEKENINPSTQSMTNEKENVNQIEEITDISENQHEDKRGKQIEDLSNTDLSEVSLETESSNQSEEISDVSENQIKNEENINQSNQNNQNNQIEENNIALPENHIVKKSSKVYLFLIIGCILIIGLFICIKKFIKSKR